MKYRIKEIIGMVLIGIGLLGLFSFLLTFAALVIAGNFSFPLLFATVFWLVISAGILFAGKWLAPDKLRFGKRKPVQAPASAKHPIQKKAPVKTVPKENRPEPVKDNRKKYAALMSGQLVAKYKKTHDSAYSDEYERRLRYIGFTEPEAKNMFMFELMILKHDHIEVLADDGYLNAGYFNLKNRLLREPAEYYIEHQRFLCSEIVKIWDEAEWLYFRIRNRTDIPEDVFKEIYEITRYGGGDLFVGYIRMIAEKAHTDLPKVQKYAASEQNLLFKYKWNREKNEKHPYGA